ncbi:DUF4269 domain-containing protein [Peptostreptococcaceae bacterium AGR-M142]
MKSTYWTLLLGTLLTGIGTTLSRTDIIHVQFGFLIILFAVKNLYTEYKNKNFKIAKIIALLLASIHIILLIQSKDNSDISGKFIIHGDILVNINMILELFLFYFIIRGLIDALKVEELGSFCEVITKRLRYYLILKISLILLFNLSSIIFIASFVVDWAYMYLVLAIRLFLILNIRKYMKLLIWKQRIDAQNIFEGIGYLKYGNEKQIISYEILRDINIFKILKEYQPVLVGTIPIDIDTDTSDLDIVCKVDDFFEFKKLLKENFSKFKNFKIKFDEEKQIMICNFFISDMEIEIYSSKLDSKKTNGYRHMIIEHRILNLLNLEFKEQIIELKKNGLKTEPAFGKLLGMDNPYEELLLLENLNDEELKVFLGEDSRYI